LRLAGGAISKSSELSAGVAFRRDHAGWSPGVGQQAALVVGGIVPTRGYYTNCKSAGVDRLTIDGQLYSLPSLQQPRSGARVFRLPDGALVVADGRGTGHDDETQQRLGMEWLVSEHAGPADVWQTLPDAPIAHYGQQADGQLLALTAAGTLQRLRVERSSDGRPQLHISDLPRLPELRIERDNYYPPIPIGLADGRVLVVDGHTATQRIAVLDPQEREAEMTCEMGDRYADDDCMTGLEYPPGYVDDADAAEPAVPELPSTAADPPAAADGDWPEQYQGYGRLERSRHYLILEPGATQWRRSARSELEGDAVQVLPDGRVVRIGLLAQAEDNAPRPAVIEISSVDGSAWQRLPERPYSYWGTRILVVDGELFVYGLLRQNGPEAVFHFDVARQHWQVVRSTEEHPQLSYRALRLFVHTMADGRQLLLPELPPER
jgi:hypothetical protein